MEDRRAQDQKANVPKGGSEPVSSRQAGSEDKGLLFPTQDSNTESRRQKYGETERSLGCVPQNVGPSDVNDTKTKRNLTRDEVLNHNQCRHMSQ
jgi:hypothetical protein